MSMREFVNELGGMRAEGELIKTIAFSLVSSFALFGILYYLRLRSVASFWDAQGFFLLLSLVSYAFVVPVVHHIRAYRTFACMPGMMIGMTLGMIAGFLAGFFVGATNGMFVGGVFGMIVGIFLGSWMGGSSCGIMGFMEGCMAGFMGGLMGAMTAVMLLNDHVRAMSVIVLVVCIVMLGGLHYMTYSEMKRERRQRSDSQALVISLSLVLAFATIWLMVYGPRSGLFN